MRVALSAPLPGIGPGVRSFEPDDEAALGGLMYRAYLHTVDYDGETPGQAALEVSKTIRGEYGAFLPSCSKVFERTGSLVSATLITRLRGRPFVGFTFTDPAYSRQGLARQCMQASMFELVAQGEHELGLLVTMANTPAVNLYRKLGFQHET